MNTKKYHKTGYLQYTPLTSVIHYNYMLNKSFRESICKKDGVEKKHTGEYPELKCAANPATVCFTGTMYAAQKMLRQCGGFKQTHLRSWRNEWRKKVRSCNIASVIIRRHSQNSLQGKKLKHKGAFE